MDVVFPAFLFIVGMSIPFALGSRLGKGEPLWKTAWHVLTRTSALLAIGILMVNESPEREQMGWSPALWCTWMYLAAIFAFCSLTLPQRQRLKVLDGFKNGIFPVLIATDVASRGLHIDGVTHVINYDLPQDPEDYVHRIGRTGRAGAGGKAISLACEDCVLSLPDIEAFIKQKIPVMPLTDEMIVTDYKRASGGPKKKELSHIMKPRERRRPHGKVQTPKSSPRETKDPNASQNRPPRHRKHRGPKPGAEGKS